MLMLVRLLMKRPAEMSSAIDLCSMCLSLPLVLPLPELPMLPSPVFRLLWMPSLSLCPGILRWFPSFV